MKQQGIGKHTVEALQGQIELQKALLQHLQPLCARAIAAKLDAPSKPQHGARLDVPKFSP